MSSRSELVFFIFAVAVVVMVISGYFLVSRPGRSLIQKPSTVAQAPAPAAVATPTPTTPPPAVATPPVTPPAPAVKAKPTTRAALAKNKAKPSPVIPGPPAVAPAAAQPPAPAPQLAALELAPPSKGAGDPLVRVIIFSDYQCPVCRRAASQMHGVMEALAKEPVQFVFLNNALEMHSKAKGAALAGMAAHKQGKFWDYHDMVFANNKALSKADLIGYAKELGLDLATFEKDMADPALEAQIEAEAAIAVALGAKGTPAFFINGKKQVGWGSQGGMQSMIEKELAAAKAFKKPQMSNRIVRRARIKELSETADLYIKYVVKGVFKGK